ncbi:transposase, partial [Trujillonella humicola]|uniref:transposase n=1 Tax=Trujillonella humicola TaxID=3383699 RepID=UPI00390635FF
KGGPLAHLPSGSYPANAAWLACAVIAFNLARAAAVAAGMATARWATLRAKIIHVAARVAATGRQLVVHLPRDWPWARAWQLLFDTATSPPPATAT